MSGLSHDECVVRNMVGGAACARRRLRTGEDLDCLPDLKYIDASGRCYLAGGFLPVWIRVAIGFCCCCRFVPEATRDDMSGRFRVTSGVDPFV